MAVPESRVVSQDELELVLQFRVVAVVGPFDV
jgi:hypothetical protein